MLILQEVQSDGLAIREILWDKFPDVAFFFGKSGEKIMKVIDMKEPAQCNIEVMIRSLKKKDGFHPMLKEYTQVYFDECHHAASDSAIEVL